MQSGALKEGIAYLYQPFLESKISLHNLHHAESLSRKDLLIRYE